MKPAAPKKAPTGAGRPRSYPAEPMKVKAIRLTGTQRTKLDKLGGDQWVRDRIDEAKE